MCVCECVRALYHNIEALQCWSLCDHVLQPIREDVAWTSVFKHSSCHAEVLRVVKHRVPIEEEMTVFVRQGWI